MGMDTRLRIPLLIGSLFTPIALYVGWVSGGAGHGSYVWARILLPYALLLALVLPYPSSMAHVLIITLAALQYPAYGCFVGMGRVRGRVASFCALLAVIHIMAALLLFTLLKENFE